METMASRFAARMAATCRAMTSWRMAYLQSAHSRASGESRGRLHTRCAALGPRVRGDERSVGRIIGATSFLRSDRLADAIAGNLRLIDGDAHTVPCRQ